MADGRADDEEPRERLDAQSPEPASQIDAPAPSAAPERAPPGLSAPRVSDAREATRRRLLLCLAFAAPCAIIALSVASMIRDTDRSSAAPSPPPSSSSSAAVVTEAPTEALALPGTAPVERPESSPPEFYDETDDGEPSPTTKKAAPKGYATVQQAAAESCSTASVEGLSQQIIEQARCIKPNAFVPLPKRQNLVLRSNVFPYLELAARDHLLRALAAHASRRMTINSALRTVAQQYLVSRWAGAKRCGVQLATQPGESHHESGTALDIAEPSEWRRALEDEDFRWLGAADRVHFDYKPAPQAPGVSTDVLAFQMLWNQNHANDLVPANGRYTRATELRLKKAPATGFPIGPTCHKASAATHP